jgi:cysteine desulfuration protein SufE
MSIAEKEKELIAEFELFDDWMDKYEHIIDQSKSLQPIDARYKTDDYLVKGCQSKVWLHADFKDGKVYYTADSDAVITKGIIALLIRVLSGETPEQIINAEMKFIQQIGLQEHLSPNRANGLSSMIKQMKTYALGFQLLEKQQNQ